MRGLQNSLRKTCIFCFHPYYPQLSFHLGTSVEEEVDIGNYHADPLRIFTMGTSSGAMMTNVLLGAYPDVFAAGSACADVALGCLAGDGYDVWNSDCADGLIIKTGAEGKGILNAAYPGYRGFRPKMQVFGGTADAVLNPQNVKEEIKE